MSSILKKLTLGITFFLLIFSTGRHAAALETIQFQYDIVDRLTKTIYGDNTELDYIYDLMGNRVAETVTLAGVPANNAPNTPAQPSPANGASSVSPQSITLAWNGGDPDSGDAVYYEVYLGTAPTPVLYTTTDQTSIVIDQLDNLQTYQWQVVARDNRNARTAGPVWQFSTSNSPPNDCSDPWPAHNATIVPDNVILSWSSGGDPDAGDAVTGYDLYFGTDPDPALLVQDLSAASHPLAALTANQTYYWRVAPKDNHGAVNSTGPVWSFQTTDQPTPIADVTYSSDTTLDAASGPYVMQGTITVAFGASLTIAPGTVLKFDSGATLLVEGNLTAAGDANNPIVFTSSTDDTHGGDTNGDGSATVAAPGDWQGITISNAGGNNTAILSHVTVLYADTGMMIANTNDTIGVQIDDGTIAYSQTYGVRVRTDYGGPGTVDIQNSEIHHNGTGVYVDTNGNGSMDIDITDCGIHHNTGGGVHTNYRGGYPNALTLQDSHIYENEDDGIYVDIYHYNTVHLDILDNVIDANHDFGITIYLLRNQDSGSHYLIQGNTISNTKSLSGDSSGSGIHCSANTSSYYTGNGHLPVSIVDNLLESNARHGVFVNTYRASGSSWALVDAQIQNNTISENGASGIFSNGEFAADISHNEIYNNVAYGIRAYTGTNLASITYNEIFANGMGIYIESPDGSTISHNNLYANGFPAVENAGGAVEALDCYWGEYTEEMAAGGNPKNISGIFDYWDNPALGEVDYSNWLAEPIDSPAEILSAITQPLDGGAQRSFIVNFTGVASATAGVDFVEISVDNGQSWHLADGQESWAYTHEFADYGTYQILSRMTDLNGQEEPLRPGITFTIDPSLTTTSGVVTDDETWSGQVQLTGDIEVRPGVTVTILPNAQLDFARNSDDRAAGNYSDKIELVITGNLVANQATFTSSDVVDPQPGDWGGIRIEPGSPNTTIEMTGCTIAYATNGLTVTGQNTDAIDLTFRDGAVQACDGHGIHLELSGDATLTGTIENNDILDNNANGIRMSALDQSVLQVSIGDNDDVANNGAAGLYFENRGSGQHSLTITDNTFDGNQGYGICAKIYSPANGNMVLSVSGNLVTQTAAGAGDPGDGIAIITEEDAAAVNTQYQVSANQSLNSANNGISIYAYSGAEVDVDVVGNTASNCGNTGISFYSSSNIWSPSENSVIRPLVESNIVTGNAVGLNYNGRGVGEVISNTFSNNSGNGIFADSGDTSEFRHNQIMDNGGFGVEDRWMRNSTFSWNKISGNTSGGISASRTVYAQQNWWGDASGPYHATANPGGLGNSVTDYVDFNPWATDENDLDMDGIPDAWEFLHFNDLSTAGATSDYDGDGLLDIDEYVYGSDPRLTDSDGDTMPDGWEAQNGLDPAVADGHMDADGDGYSNRREYMAGTNPLDDQDLPGIIADLDVDGDVDGSDLMEMIGQWGRIDCTPETPCSGDLDADADVDDVDLIFFAEDYGRTAP